MTEYLSISRVIAKSKKQYEKSFLYTENDDMDLGYFIDYNLNVLEQSFQQLKEYIQKKQNEKLFSKKYLKIGNINERQSQIIQMFVDEPEEIITVKDIQTKFSITPTTAKTDIIGLIDKGILQEVYLNKRKRGYIRGNEFNNIVNFFTDKMTEGFGSGI